MTKNTKITVSDNFQKNYTYELTEPEGKHFDPEFKPDLTPKQMLEIGIFGGAYFVGVEGGIPEELPRVWFKNANLSPDNKKHKEFNYFSISASQPLRVWQEKGWIHKDDPHGWFQWYCRYYLGRRHEDDERQIKRWKAMRRHIAQVVKNCRAGDEGCRPKQRQALLHWAHDSIKL